MAREEKKNNGNTSIREDEMGIVLSLKRERERDGGVHGMPYEQGRVTTDLHKKIKGKTKK